MHKTSIYCALAAAIAAASSSGASAGTPSGPYAMFKYCPYNDPAVSVCVRTTTTSGVFTIGRTSVPIDKQIVLQGGVESLGASPLHNAVGAPTLASPPAKVPGGLLGLVEPGANWPVVLKTAYWTIVGTANDVTATIEPVKTIQTNFGNALYPPTDGSDPTAARLAVRVKLSNPFLGNDCYIGSAQEPIVLKLQTGTTNPPPPNQPISGKPGTTRTIYTDEENYIGYLEVSGSTLVDNAFAVPKARGCGNVALGLPIVTDVLDALVSGAVNLKVGLPSAAGKNTAIMNGMSVISAAAYVKASER